ncbi:MAG TPA: hypothetical protein DEP66_05650 [Acidimicrobiaceae bacterium]|nr:hypothetical protein [Acidimicrobiaceae bacterium]
MLPSGASSVAKVSRSGGLSSGGRVNENSSGAQYSSGGAWSGGELMMTSSSASIVRGSAVMVRLTSSGPPQAFSGWRSTSQVCWRLYVSMKWRSSWTWKPWSSAWFFRSAT